MKRVLIIVTVIMLIICIFASMFITYLCTEGVSEMYYEEITLKEDVVFDDQQFIELYGKSVTLTAGMKGHAVDVIDSNGDTKSYEYINAHFCSTEGIEISVAISIDPEADTTILNISDSNITDIWAVFSISKIESYQTVLSDYQQTRERFHSRIRNTWITGTAITTVIVGILVCLLFLESKKLKR